MEIGSMRVRSGVFPLRLPKWCIVAILIAITGIALMVRLIWFPHTARDYEVFLSPWYEQIKAGGGFAAIGQPIGDYLPSYIYILAALTYLPINSLYAIKLVSFIGDIILSCYAARIILEKTRKTSFAISVYMAVLLLPTVWLNSGAWGQCDSIYTAFLLASVFYFMCDRPRAGMIAYATAFVFKLQAVFLAPLILLLWMKKKVAFRQLLYVPAAYIIVILPAAMAGRNIGELLTIYFRQAGSYSALSMGAPNFYAFLDVENPMIFSVFGLVLFAVIMIMTFRYLWKRRFDVPQDFILKFAMFSTVAVPFLLPHMHERYFYPADVLAAVYAFVYPKRWFVPVVIVASSTLVYSRYLFGVAWANAAYATVPMFGVLCLLLHDVLNDIRVSTR